MTNPLEDYALIGDGESAALACRTGSIDWMCWPRFDSDACFAALVGDERNGRWTVKPLDCSATAEHRYRPDTLIVERDFLTGSGAARVIDFMTMREGSPTLVRQVQGMHGSVPMKMLLSLRFDYGSVPPWIDVTEHRMVARMGPDLIVLYADVDLKRHRHDVAAEFVMHEGKNCSFILRFGPSTADPPASIDPQQALTTTESFWLSWIGRFDRPTHWPQAVRRSLITLKALINRPTGGMVAAPTTSLPEVPGGELNWDYRYCWVRDATFTLAALLNAGYHAEGTAWRDWFLRAIGGTAEHIQVMYRIDGARHLSEWTVPKLSGYRWSPPVRVGNGASGQKQIDIYGEIIDAMDLAERAGIEMTAQAIAVEDNIVKHVEKIWREPGHGIWEQRGEPRHFVYSKVMAWVAIDRFLKRNAHDGSLDRDLKLRLAGVRKDIHDEVCAEGFHTGMNSFVQHYGGKEVDASLLLMPVVGFLPANDPRIAATVARIERELMDNGLVYRTRHSAQQSQGAFLACNCWLADCRQMQGRTDAAREALERLMEVRSDLGLLSEEYDISGKHLSGNFPQALSHLALVTSALGLSGPVLQRGGG